ncbi:MAG: ribosomal protein S18-alanine N-acetyltransferase [Lactococcus raffinolactis]|nr:ribosomal protein S18-alanine N-acetyltransferase [Lactococcus raffinolactis]
MTDCYRDFAGDIQAILDELYEVSPWTFEQTFADLLREETVYYLAFSEDQKVLGFLALSVVMDEIEITNIAVAKAYQSQGIASLLLKQLAELDGKIFLEVRASNDKARRLYEKFEFEAYYQRKGYYQNPQEDAILMKREK